MPAPRPVETTAKRGDREVYAVQVGDHVAGRYNEWQTFGALAELATAIAILTTTTTVQATEPLSFELREPSEPEPVDVVLEYCAEGANYDSEICRLERAMAEARRARGESE